jgi:hypothetical protein
MSVEAVAMPNDGPEGAPRKGIVLRGSVIRGRVRIGSRDDVVSGDASVRRCTPWQGGFEYRSKGAESSVIAWWIEGQGWRG